MKKTNLVNLKIVLVILAAATAGLSFGHTFTPSESTLSKSSKFDGGSDFAAYCVRCHGSDGRSQTTKGRQTKAPDLTQSRVSDSKALRMLTTGSGEMPSFKKTLDTERMREVVAYTRTLRR